MGLILDPGTNYNIDCYPDNNCAGVFGHEHLQDPHCIRSRTGYIIYPAVCPVLYVSKLQTEITLSALETQYIALSLSCKDLLSSVDLDKEVGTTFGLPIGDLSNMHVRVNEDNGSALTLGNIEPHCVQCHYKHHSIKYHWFCE